MYQPKLEKDIRCPLVYAQTLFGGTWKPRILCVLSRRQPRRYGELRRELVNITDAVLTSALRELAQDGLVCRTQYEETPLRVEYALTRRGETLVPLLQAVCQWAGAYVREGEDPGFSQCQRCDYRAIGHEETAGIYTTTDG